MELRTAASGYRSVADAAHDDEEDARSSSTSIGISGSLEALRATRHGTPTEWVTIRYPTRDDFARLWASIRDPASRARDTKLPFARIVSVVLYAVGGLVLVALCILGVVGYFKYRSLFHPHHAKHASKADLRSGNVVKPFFAPPGADGLVDQLDVGVSIWFREGNLTTPSDEELGRTVFWRGVPAEEMSLFEQQRQLYWMQENTRVDGEDGFVRNETRQLAWEKIWTAEVAASGVQHETRRSLAVTVPGRIVHSLVTNPLSRLVATFDVYPHDTRSLGIDSAHLSHLSSRPVDKYGDNKPWPVAPVPTASSAAPALGSFLAHAGVGYDLKRFRHARYDGTRSWDDPDMQENAIFTRTWLTMANDYPVYERESFKQALGGLRRDKEGHFENLLDVDDKQQYYGPFLTTRLTTVTNGDYHLLPPYSVLNRTSPDAVNDLRYDWTFIYSAISPGKLALVDRMSDVQNLFDSDRSETETARRHDKLEFYNALIGHSFNPNAHPIARTAIGGLAAFLRYLTVPLIFHYWLTRRTVTGIVLAWWFAQTVSDVVFHIVHSLTNQHYFNLFFFLVKLLGFIVIGLVQLRLLTGVEVRFTNLLPSAVRLRGSTEAERKSAEADRRLDWRLRIAAFLILFLGLRLAPAIPPLIRATLETKEDPLIRLYWNDQQSPVALLWLRNLSSWSSAMWLITRLNQIHLNFRHGTFAAFHPLTSYFLVASLVLSHITTVFRSFFGRAQSQGPLTAWDILTLVVEVTLALQARRLPVVNQREDGFLG
ncbi:hypothetical protein Rhopal_006504-T1 [Rhodotorula paludigena]|uniref:Uncharacterized protein n=1 Tax=Rhodotorula paludigena TaxID=86838 RepID=A0AAV5GT92_9BASI|nr:hypothetical protein Rhopal_006504-T1 [Rhodotorula paludigena]